MGDIDGRRRRGKRRKDRERRKETRASKMLICG